MDDMPHDRPRQDCGETPEFQRVIKLLNSGDASVRGELLNIARKQLMRLTRQWKREFDRLHESKELNKPLDELFANISARLYQALHDARIKDARHFYQLASLQIRRELIDICRPGDAVVSNELQGLAELHDSVDSLPGDQREVFELVWYHEMTRTEVADLLGISQTSVRRLWRSARLGLNDRLDSDWAERGSGSKFAGD